jgi:hypothetical protein
MGSFLNNGTNEEKKNVNIRFSTINVLTLLLDSAFLAGSLFIALGESVRTKIKPSIARFSPFNSGFYSH